MNTSVIIMRSQLNATNKIEPQIKIHSNQIVISGKRIVICYGKGCEPNCNRTPSKPDRIKRSI
jgi:hypothetical protein